LNTHSFTHRPPPIHSPNDSHLTLCTHSLSQPGDELVRVNGLTLVEATHEEVVNLIKLRKTLTLTLKGEELLPPKTT